MNLIDQVRGVFQASAQRKAADFAELVSILANGETIDPVEMAAQLEAVGKTPDELAAAIENKKRRSELAAVAFRLPAIHSEFAELKEAYNAELDRYHGLLAEHEQTVAPMANRAQALELEIKTAIRAAETLRATYRGPLLDQLAEVNHRQAALNSEIAGLQRTRDHVGSELHRAQIGNATPETLASYESTLAGCNAQIEQLSNQLSDLDQRATQIVVAMLKP